VLALFTRKRRKMVLDRRNTRLKKHDIWSW